MIPVYLYNRLALAYGHLLCRYGKLVIRNKPNQTEIEDMYSAIEQYIDTLDGIKLLNNLDNLET